MREGIVLEVSQQKVTVLTPEGEFLQIPKLGMEYIIGQEIAFAPPAVKPRPGIRHSAWKSLAAMAAIIFLVLTTVLPVYESNQIAAYMSIDVNPSIELGLNNELLVVTLEAYNKEGEQVVAGLKGWRKEEASSVAGEILDSIRTLGYFSEDNQVLIGTVNSRHEQGLEQVVNGLKQKEQDLDMQVVTGTITERESAVNQGITTGVYKSETRKETEQAAPASAEQPSDVVPGSTPASTTVQDPISKESHPSSQQVPAVNQTVPAPSKGDASSQTLDKPGKGGQENNKAELKAEKKNDVVQQHKVETNDQKKNHKDEKEPPKANKGNGVQNYDKNSKEDKEQTKKDAGKGKDVQLPNKNSKEDKEQAKKDHKKDSDAHNPSGNKRDAKESPGKGKEKGGNEKARTNGPQNEGNRKDAKQNDKGKHDDRGKKGPKGGPDR